MNRWFRLVAAVIAMIMIANLQYSWTLFVKPIIAATGWKLSEVQWGFTAFIALETWGMPATGWLIGLIGPRAFMSIGGILCGIGWASLGLVHTLPELYLVYAMAGLGASMVYSASISMALKWFPDKRGLATGLIVAGFGAGAALFIPTIAHTIRNYNYETAFLYSGVLQGLTIIAAAQFLKNPGLEFLATLGAFTQKKSPVRHQTEQFNSIEMLKTPHFYLLYIMMLLMGIGGLMVTAQVGPVASSFKIGAAALTIAITMNPIANGLSRVSWGWVSDYLGREWTMIVAFTLQSLCLVSVMTIGRFSETRFIVCLFLVYFTWGEIYSLFAPAAADFFGAQHSSSNYSFLYSSKGVASIMGGGLAALLFEKTGTWAAAFYGSAVLAFIAAMLGFVLRAMPVPQKHHQPAHEMVMKEV